MRQYLENRIGVTLSMYIVRNKGPPMHQSVNGLVSRKETLWIIINQMILIQDNQGRGSLYI